MVLALSSFRFQEEEEKDNNNKKKQDNCFNRGTSNKRTQREKLVLTVEKPGGEQRSEWAEMNSMSP